MTHSPTPWIEDSFDIRDADGKEILSALFSDLQSKQDKLNIRRAVLCVNACENISDEHLANAAENTRIIIANAKAMEELLREVVEFDRISNGRLPIPLSTIHKIKNYVSTQ